MPLLRADIPAGAPVHPIGMPHMEMYARLSRGLGHYEPYVPAVARHLSAVFFLTLALQHYQEGNNLMASVEEVNKHSVFIPARCLYAFTIIMALTYYYLVTFGRTTYRLSPWIVSAKGAGVKSARKVHRLITAIALSSGVAVLLTALCLELVFDLARRQKMSEPLQELSPSASFSLTILKIDKAAAVIFICFVLFRYATEPVGWKNKSKSHESTKGSERPTARPLDGQGFPIPLNEPEECDICAAQAANRQLKCGHVLCCCCIEKIAPAHEIDLMQCPFCRKFAEGVRRLEMKAGAVTSAGDCEHTTQPKTTQEDTVDSTPPHTRDIMRAELGHLAAAAGVEGQEMV